MTDFGGKLPIIHILAAHAGLIYRPIQIFCHTRFRAFYTTIVNPICPLTFSVQNDFIYLCHCFLHTQSQYLIFLNAS